MFQLLVRVGRGFASVWSGIRTLWSWFGRGARASQRGAERILWKVAPALPLVLLGTLVFCGTVYKPRLYCKPLMLGFDMPSERAIPNPAPHEGINPDDIVRRFRYHPTGTEANAGVPYWVFQALPRMFPEELDNRGWERFGMLPDDMKDYPDRTVPRGLAISDTLIHLPGFRVGLELKRVSINCSGCHRGEYYDKDGKRVLVDGMPNHVIDTQGYKRFVKWAFAQPNFTAERLIRTIDELLEERGNPRLTTKERLIYQAIWLGLRKTGKTRTWMDVRPANGPGRISAFNAVKFEIIGAPDDGTIGTVDLPSLWNQRKSIRLWHHWDGDTQSIRARNYGSIIGVGGSALSVRGRSVDLVGQWLDQQLPVPAWPFDPPSQDLVDAGEQIYLKRCKSCHGVYDPKTRSMTDRGEWFMQRKDVGTDTERWKSFNEATAAALNDYGARRGVWLHDSFRPAVPGYLVPPLDGIWARAPYLHNGSVPTLEHLLRPVAERPQSFYRGHRKYDPVRVGFVYTEPEDKGRKLFLYETGLRGNKNIGHEFVVPESERAALLAYLKTL